MFVRNSPIVIKGRIPKHGPVRHHAFANLIDNLGVAAGGAAALAGDPQVAGVHEPYKFGRFAIQ